MVNEPSVFELSRFYCIYDPEAKSVIPFSQAHLIFLPCPEKAVLRDWDISWIFTHHILARALIVCIPLFQSNRKKKIKNTRGLTTLGRFFAILYVGENFCDFSCPWLSQLVKPETYALLVQNWQLALIHIKKFYVLFIMNKVDANRPSYLNSSSRGLC